MNLDPGVGSLLDTRYERLMAVLHDYVQTLVPDRDAASAPTIRAALDTELPNVIEVMDTLLAETYVTPDPLTQLLALDLLVSLEHELSRWGLWQSKRRWALSLLAHRSERYAHLDTVLSNVIGSACSEAGDHAAAVRYYEQAIRQSAADEDDPELARVYGNLGVAYWSLRQLDAALHYTRRLFEAVLQQGRLHDAARALANLAQIHFDRGEFDDALTLSFDALRLASRLGDPALQAQFTGIVAAHMLGAGLADKAGPVFATASQMLRAQSDPIGLALNELNYALWELLRQRPDQARVRLVECLSTFEQYGMEDEARIARDRLAQCGG